MYTFAGTRLTVSMVLLLVLILSLPLAYADPINKGVRVTHYKNTTLEKLLVNPPAQKKLRITFATSFEKIYFSSPHNLREKITNATDIYMARNEIESVQLVLLPFQNLKNITVKLSQITHDDSKEVFPKDAIEIRPVGYINQYKTRHKASAKRWHPDPLFPEQSLTLYKAEPQPVLLSFDTRNNVTAGTYTGTVSIQQHNTTLATATIKLHVWNIRLPDVSRFKTSAFARWQSVIDMWPGQLKNQATIMKQFDLLAALSFKNRLPVTGHFANGLDNYSYKGHGGTSINTTIHSRINGRLILDPNKVNERLKILRKNHVNHFFMGFLSNLSKPENLTTKRSRVAKHYLKDYAEYLVTNKLTQGAYVYNIDEPWGDNVAIAKQQYRDFKKIVGDKIKVMQNTNQNNDRIIPELIGYFDVLDINLGFYHKVKLQHYRKKYPGQLKEVWWNINLWPSTRPNVFIEYPLIDARIIGPMSFKYNIQGFEYWDLFNASTIKESVPLKLGKLRISPRASWTSLDGTLVYPAEDKSILSSLRLEAMRDGFEDMELLYILQDLQPNHPLLSVPVINDIYDFENSATVYSQYRNKLAKTILQHSTNKK